jgi:hypothetical protein
MPIANKNLWPLQGYQNKNILIVLRNTYTGIDRKGKPYDGSTYPCAQNFYEGRWHDLSFGFLIDCVVRNRNESREAAMKRITLTNYCKRIFNGDEDLMQRYLIRTTTTLTIWSHRMISESGSNWFTRRWCFWPANERMS